MKCDAVLFHRSHPVQKAETHEMRKDRDGEKKYRIAEMESQIQWK